MFDELRPDAASPSPRRPVDRHRREQPGLLAAFLGDEATVAWCLGRVTPYGRLLPGRPGPGSVRCDGAVASGQRAPWQPRLGRTDEARRWLTEAIAMDERIGALPYRVLSEIELARVLAGGPEGLPAAAIDLAQRAADTARRLGMAPALRRRGGAARPGCAPSGTPPTRVTAREREVLARLAAGRTNRQIAAELVLSERTIETHVGHVAGQAGRRQPGRGCGLGHGRNGV